MNKKRILLTIAYDGTEYSGWQKQKNSTVKTIEEEVEKACKKLFGVQNIEVIGASRTDAGVHALGQRAMIEVETSIPTEKIPFAIRSFLPEDIVVQKAENVPNTFHPRYDCIKKTYCYTYYNNSFANPIVRRNTVFVHGILDILSMQKAAKYIEGKKDFKCFCAAGSSVCSTIRTVFDCSVQKEGNFVKIYITGDGFLYNMVRIIAGTLLEIGKGKKTPEEIQNMIANKNRNLAGMTAPPQGLTLMEIDYDFAEKSLDSDY
ncbi:MAG TPA: tRNA pseudouridine(38-40) synthase TruA [Candidatus Coprocola pullicola]|nr:tRNA pseudouridine(38-40) synthase TruA [Candidatus Coprocola pullicola]